MVAGTGSHNLAQRVVDPVEQTHMAIQPRCRCYLIEDGPSQQRNDPVSRIDL
jgi:hypothetical protein